VQVNVKDILSGSFTISNEEIDPFTFHSTLSQRRGDSLSDAKHMSAGIFIQVGERSGVFVGNHQDMAGIYWLNIHKSRTKIIAIDQAGW
jgi:hypothetical protein